MTGVTEVTGLDVGERIMLLLLERVHDGHVTRSFDPYFEDDGRVVWHMVSVALAALLETGSLQLGEAAPGRSRRVDLTEQGLVGYRELGERHRR